MRVRIPSPILYIDAYDSFTNNIIDLLETKLNVQVTVIKIDTVVNDIEQYLKSFFAVILGPGPGDPRNAGDVGLYRQILTLRDEKVTPVLGVCLGFQSLVLAFGGDVQRLPQPRHGIIRTIWHDSKDIFHGVAQGIDVVQYHSLHATCETAEDHDFRSQDIEIIPLAWDCQTHNLSSCQSWSENPATILMAARHKRRPFHGLQFHPESICSSLEAQQIILNWWKEVLIWWNDHPARRILLQGQSIVANTHGSDGEKYLDFNRIPSGSQSQIARDYEGHERLCASATTTTTVPQDLPYNKLTEEDSGILKTKVTTFSGLNIPKICSYIRSAGWDVVLLDSENHQRQDVGEYSIIGLVHKTSLRFEYNEGSRYIRELRNGQAKNIDLNRSYEGDPLQFLKVFVKQRTYLSGDSRIPFWGGLIGYISYEACLERLDCPKSFTFDHKPESSVRPDLGFVFAERSIVVDHRENNVHIQSLIPGDTAWLESTHRALTRLRRTFAEAQQPCQLNAHVILPNQARYKSAIRKAQRHVNAGDSYELCLTNRAAVITPRHHDSWLLYLRLRRLNPAPFAAYLRLGGMTLISSSPERFLSWSRSKPQQPGLHYESVCQFRPIKGTIMKRPNLEKPALTLQQAEEMLATPKEVAENLMIVDLIRHDLFGVVGSGNVRVPKLMVVEEYETLFQLVSVIEGTLFPSGEPRDSARKEPSPGNGILTPTVQSPSPRPSSDDGPSGIDVLAASLPPGSMTGAPKVRSCQLLDSIEGTVRGAYSGVVGYLDVGGGGDFSVVIRTAVRWEDGGKDDAGDKWTIGAGGAVTSLSTEEGEYEEMMAKLRSTLQLFEDGSTTYETRSDDG